MSMKRNIGFVALNMPNDERYHEQNMDTDKSITQASEIPRMTISVRITVLSTDNKRNTLCVASKVSLPNNNPS